ncbi:DUF3592 domain-containing protein [Streptomyces sp. NPDC006706]|uniref:DUF3592 domain-containing protein n=1 Tax=Streptomyces sp. NPDC006706 TaxID=3364761 RepID=UPI003678FB51
MEGAGGRRCHRGVDSIRTVWVCVALSSRLGGGTGCSGRYLQAGTPPALGRSFAGPPRGWAAAARSGIVAGPPRWAKVRLAAGGFLIFATIAGVMGWEAGQEYQVLANLRDQGRRTDATVVEITSRSEEGWATSVTVRFSTPSGPVRADVDVAPSSANNANPGAYIPVVYNPARPTEVRHAAYLDGHEAGGILQGSIVIGLLAAGFLVGTTREMLRTKRPTESGEMPGPHHPRT